MEFNLEEYLIKEAAKLDAPVGEVAPLDWDQIPGNTPEEKRSALLEMCASILRGSPNILADAYGGVQSKPMQGGYGSPNYMIPVYELYQAVMGYKGGLGSKDKKQFENLFGGNEQSIVSKALEEHGHEFDESSAYLFGGKLKDRTKIEDVKGKPADKYQALMISYRQHLVATLQKEILALGDEMSASHNVTKPEFCHLLRVKNNKGQLRYIGYGNPGSFIEKVGGIAIAEELARQARAALTSRKSEMHKLMLAPLFSGVGATEEEMKLNPKAAPISDEEILGPIGLLPSNYPNSPQMEFSVEPIPYERIPNKDLTPEQVTQKRDAWQRNRVVNIDLLRKYLIAGGYENGGGLAELVNTSKMSALKESTLSDEELEYIEDGSEQGITDSRYSAQVVYYYYSRLCNNNPKIFCDMLERAGFGYLKDATRAKVYKDETFDAYNLNFRSKAEADVVARLRSSFGLMATPIPLSMPSPPECPTNPDSFVIDFTIPCDIIEEWVPDDDGILHPEIHPKVIFVGEYFGFDFSKEIQIPNGQIWTTPDGNVATCLDDEGKPVEMTSGNTITYGQRYKLASEWKRMGETFVAHATGNAVIHIAKDSKNEEIGAELDRSNIIYAPITINGAANQQLLWHSSQCRKPDCAVHNYVKDGSVVPKKYSVAEAYISSCFTDLDIRYAYMPAIAIVNQEFGRGTMYQYYKTQQELDAKRSAAWQNYVEISKAKGDVHSAMFAYVEACKESQNSRAEFMKVLRDRMNEQKALPEYQYRQNGLRRLLDQVQSGAPYNDAQISQECTRYLSPYTPIPRN